MKPPSELVSEWQFSDCSTHIFSGCRSLKNPLNERALGIYKQRADACNMKLRFAAKAYLEVNDLLKPLEHGELIWFDDEDRLNVAFYFESLLVNLRASLDTAVSAYYTYFTGNPSLDSAHQFLREVGRGLDWVPAESHKYWQEVYKAYKSATDYTWIQALVGRDKGHALRDFVLHKGTAEIGTLIDANDRGKFYVQLAKGVDDYAIPWIANVYGCVASTIDFVIDDIMRAEALH